MPTVDDLWFKDAIFYEAEKGSPFLLEFVVKEGHDFSRYNLAGL